MEEISETDRRNHELLTMHKAHHPKDEMHRLYIKRKQGGRTLINIEECVEDAIAGLHQYVQNSKERLICAAWRILGEQEVAEPRKKIKKDGKPKENKIGRIEESMASSSKILRISPA